MILRLDVDRNLHDRLRAVFGDELTSVALKSLLRTLGEEELKKFAAKQRQELEAEAARLNKEFGL